MQRPERFSRFEYLGVATQPHFVQRVIEVLEIIHPFDDFERSDVMTMLTKMDCYRVPPHSTVIYEDEPGDFLILLLYGNVEIVKKDNDGIYRQLGLASQGKVLGEMSLIDEKPRSAGCIASSELTFAVLDRNGLNDILRNEPNTGCKILMVLLMMSTERLRDISGRMAYLLGNANMSWM